MLYRWYPEPERGVLGESSRGGGSYSSKVTFRAGGDLTRSGEGERAAAYCGSGENDCEGARWGRRGGGISSSDSSGVNWTRLRGAALTFGGGEMVERGAACCSDFF